MTIWGESGAATRKASTKRDMTDSANWTNPGLVADPNAGTGGIPDDGKLWGVSDTRTEVYGTAGANYSANDTDVERPLGLNLQGCYDFLQGETWSVGLNLRFAGYWNMKSSSRGRYNAGSTHTEFDADGRSSSQTDCLLGFGGNVGLVGNITDNIGIYGQVGYEWIDSTDVSTGGFKADVDYSSFVLSAGVQVRF